MQEFQSGDGPDGAEALAEHPAPAQGSAPPRSGADQFPISAPSEEGPIDVAGEPEFAIGPLRVSPPLLRVSWDGRAETLQRRVMQVLVLLACHRGGAVSHELLSARCWNGRLVGDDAAQRCVARLRRLGRDSRAFSIETLPRVGYRLVDARGESRSPGRSPRGWLWGLAAAGGATVLALAAVALLAGRPHTDPEVAVQPFRPLSPERETALFAESLQAEITGVLNENQIVAVAESPSAGPLAALAGWLRRDAAPDFRLRGAVTREAGAAQARITLIDRRSGEAVWSFARARPWAERDALRQQLPTAVNEAVQTAREPYQQPGLSIDPQTLGLHIRGALALEEQTDDRAAVPALQAVVRRAPDFATAHAHLSVALLESCNPSKEPGRASCAEGRAEAERAIAIRPASAGGGFDALFKLAMIEHPHDLAAAEDTLLKGLAQAPDFPFLHMRECMFLTNAGLAREALGYCQRAVALRPLAEPPNFRLVRALMEADQPGLARQVALEGFRHTPDTDISRVTRAEVLVFSGPPDEARALLEDPNQRPQAMTPETIAALSAVLDARASGAPAEADRALARLAAAAPDPSVRRFRVLAAALFGRPDLAWSILGDGAASDGEANALLLLPVSAPLRRDSRFWDYARRSGLLAYWRVRRPPDVCREPALQVACRDHLGTTVR